MSGDVFTMEIIKDALIAVGQEMFESMIRTSMSPIIYEATDFAVGVTDAAGNLLAQGNGVAGFLATLDSAVRSTLTHYPEPGDLKPGDVLMTNVPYEGGGTHLSDVTILVPVFYGMRLIGWTVNKAHWTEVGGTFPGSATTQSTEIFQEGVQFPFIKLFDEGKINQAVVAMIRANVRLPESTLGDMHAGVATARVGARRVLELVDKYGDDLVVDAMENLLNYGERMTRAEITKLPQGVYFAEDYVESDGHGNGPFRIKVRVEIKNGRIVADFTGTDPQARGPINCSFTGLETGVRCVFKAITNPELPANGGCFRLLDIICPEGTFISASSPAPVSLYYESLLAAMDTMWKALAPAMPDRLPAGHQRSVGATFISGTHPETGQLFVLGEPLVGGWGAAFNRDGDNGQFCAANGETFNIPTELFEARYGLQVTQYAFHNEDGGAGLRRGGKGCYLDYKVVCDEVFLTYAASHTKGRPWALSGGEEGSVNQARILRSDGTVEIFSMCTQVRVGRGETIRLVTATGGGFGDPLERNRQAILQDVKNGYITEKQARDSYMCVC